MMSDTSPSFAIYIAGMDMNVDLIDCAVSCLKDRAKVCCPIYVGVEEAEYEREGVTTLHVEKGKQWTGRARAHLEQIKESHVIVLLEDYFVYQLDEKAIQSCLDLMEPFNAGVIKLYPIPRPNHGIGGQDNLGFYKPFLLGRTNTQPALWDKAYLLDLLYKNESLWDFEINGSVRSNTLNKNVLGVYRSLLRYDEVVKKGKFRNRFKERYEPLINAADIPQNRGFLDRGEEIRFEIAHHISLVMQYIIPQHYRTLLRRILSPRND